MSLGKYYDKIDIILQAMTEYLGISDDEDYDDLYALDGEGDDDTEDFIDMPCVTKADVDSCGFILEGYLDELSVAKKSPDDAKIMKIAEKTVKKLNKLNEKCEYELIESTQSDDICDLIHNAAVEAGLSEYSENIADEWRDF